MGVWSKGKTNKGVGSGGSEGDRKVGGGSLRSRRGFFRLGMGEGVMTDLEEVLIGGENEEGVVLFGRRRNGWFRFGGGFGGGRSKINFCFSRCTGWRVDGLDEGDDPFIK